ncbi:hypothetical protein SpCBS45565_g04237 [Spizellomyces sp. 'palustris']|nr:hypothetical protein SpCBS45565_g04237 [Spizellomyces sp. 'palustris']
MNISPPAFASQRPPALSSSGSVRSHTRTASLDNARLGHLAPANHQPTALLSKLESVTSKDDEERTELPTEDLDLARMLEEEREKGSVSLNLSQRNLAKLPREIGTMVLLERLGLSNNMLSALPPELCGLAHLRYLNLRSNRMREFPLVICQLPALEILDMSRNKLKRLPNNFGTLMNLKVLSLARNRIQELPTYLGEMQGLKVLKIEHNPIQWPPPGVLQYEADVPHEIWLQTFKEFLVREGNLSRIGPNDASPDISSPPNGEPHTSGAGHRGIRRDKQMEESTEECDQLLHSVLRNDHRSSLIAQSSHGAPESEREFQLLEVLEGVAYALTCIYRIVKEIYAHAADLPVDHNVLRSWRGHMQDLNRNTCSMISVLFSKSDGEAQIADGQVEIGPGVPPSVTSLADRLPSSSIVLEEAKRNTLLATASAKALSSLVQSCGSTLMKNLDVRTSRSLITQWYSATAELADVLYTASALVDFGTGFPQSPESATSTDTTDHEPQQHVVHPSLIQSLAKSATGAAMNVLDLLKNVGKPGGTEYEGTDTDGREGSKAAGLHTELASTMETVAETTKRLSECLAAEGGGDDWQKNVTESAGRFIKAIAHMSAAARAVAINNPLGRPVMAGLHSVTRTTKELAMAVATQKSTPNPIVDTIVHSRTGT